MDKVTPYDESRVIQYECPANGRAFLSRIHMPVYVVGIASLDDSQLSAPPYADGIATIPAFQNIRGFLTLVEAGTMQPRVKRLPLQTLNGTHIERETFNGGAGGDGGFPGPMPFRLRFGPVIDLAASYIESMDNTRLFGAVEVFFRYP